MGRHAGDLTARYDEPRMTTEPPNKNRPLAPFIGAGLAIGAGIGAAMGAATGKTGLWLPIGIALGLAIGVALTKRRAG